MYAFATTATLKQAVDFQLPADFEELHYWRKHPDLHSWMERLHRIKQGAHEEFNLTPVVLRPDDVTAPEGDVLRKALPLPPIRSSRSLALDRPHRLRRDIRRSSQIALARSTRRIDQFSHTVVSLPTLGSVEVRCTTSTDRHEPMSGSEL